ncbi:carbohydrate-binding module family 5 protein [Peniophora sp. CONT]|nr:carbohydrate-binding module family 5 protein [Peniophora sp. CONT]
MVLVRAFRALAASVLLSISVEAAFDLTRHDNVVSYWGQNSYGATHDDTANWQKTLSYYCDDDAVDMFPIAFVNKFSSTGGLPEINLASTCNNVDNATFSGTKLADCSSLATDIAHCQSKGKAITISLGGAGGGVGFTDDASGEAFATTIWNLFLGGSSSTRPFGSAVLDGVDLDVESGTGTGYVAFVNKIRSLSSGSSKKYYITAAPQCVYPDAALGSVINAADFDAIFIQFCEFKPSCPSQYALTDALDNNQCGLQNYGIASDWNFGLWDHWARFVSPNPDVKIFLGAPASSTSAGGGYQDASTLSTIATTMRKDFPAFAGVMLWDESQAYVNGRYDLAIKNALVAAGGTGFTYPACSAPAFASGTSYTGGSQVSYNGYIYQAKWYATATPANDPNSDWASISACSGGSSSSPTTTASSPGSTGGSCSGVAAWSSSTVYTAGNKATYNGNVYTANWWTQGDLPTGASGAWTKGAACASTKKESSKSSSKTTKTSPESRSLEGRLSSRFFRL